MDGNQKIQDSSGRHIWLRYATQFHSGGRVHTVEMSVPVPIGANAGTREKLFLEAEAGLSHLISHVESRLPQIMQQGAKAVQPVQAGVDLTGPSASPAKVNTAKSVNKPAAAPGPQNASQALGKVQEAEKNASRSGVAIPSMPGSGTGNLSLPEFIQAIKEIDLDPRGAMNLLKVKSLSGINLREALERLQYLAAGGDVDSVPMHEQRLTRENRSTIGNATQTSANGTSRHTTNIIREEEEELEDGDEMPNGPIPVFDEELEPDEEEEEEDFVDPLDDAPAAMDGTNRERAIELINKLRDERGMTTASPARLQVLHNVIGDQITNGQLLQLIRGVWSANSLKKLKVEQVEALIYWAKQDDFVGEVETVLAFLEEGE
jgi:hypothetical protein